MGSIRHYLTSIPTSHFEYIYSTYIYPKHFIRLPHHPESCSQCLTEWLCWVKTNERSWPSDTWSRFERIENDFMVLELYFEQLATDSKYVFFRMLSKSLFFSFNEISFGGCAIIMISNGGKQKIGHWYLKRGGLADPPPKHHDKHDFSVGTASTPVG